MAAHGELELFVEQAPVVEEEDEKWREKIKVNSKALLSVHFFFSVSPFI